MKLVTALLAGFLALTFSSTAGAEDLLRIGVFSRDGVSFVANGKGFLKTEGIRTEYTHVRASVELMRNFRDGKFDLIHTTADNVIAWAEGEGADPGKNDFIMFIGGRKGLTLDLVVAREINSMADLKGKLLAVDAYNTGYAPVLVYMLKKHGMTLTKDYTMKPFGGGEARFQAPPSGEAAGGFVSLNKELEGKGFHILAKSKDYVPTYAVGMGAARRDWATKHQDLLVRYIRALIRSTDWLLDPKNKAEAIRMFRAGLENSQARAEELYEESLNPDLGVIPRGKINPEGIRVIIELRQGMGEMKGPLPPPSKYIDESYYQKAIATLGTAADERR